MKGTVTAAVLAGAAALLAATPALADTSAQNYELQEKCSFDANQFLNRLKTEDIPGGPIKRDQDPVGKRIWRTDYDDVQNHYSAEFNKCFLLVKDSETLLKTGHKTQEDLSVWDVNSGKKIAGYWESRNIDNGPRLLKWCWVQKPDHLTATNVQDDDSKDCGGGIIVDNTSLQTWYALIAPYMGDTNHNGWSMLVFFLPLICGGLILVTWLRTRGNNRTTGTGQTR